MHAITQLDQLHQSLSTLPRIHIRSTGALLPHCHAVSVIYQPNNAH